MIQSIPKPNLKFAVLSDENVIKIHQATLDVIENIGIRFPSQKALDILASCGARVDISTQVAKIPSDILMKYLEKAPSEFILAGRSTENDLILDGNHGYLGTDGCGIETIDIFTNQLRRSTKADAADSARIADALDEIGFWWAMVSAQDCPAGSRSLHELEAAWLNTSKHLQTESIVNTDEMQLAIEMASCIAGGREPLRNHPVLSIMQCTVSPLGHDGGSLEAALLAAEAGLPVGFMTMASCASSGPATMAGNMVVGNAEVISALALIQMASPRAPVFYAAAQTATDLRTGAYTGGGPEDYLFGGATNQLADFYKIPLSMGTFATGAKEPDWQAAVDNSLSSFMAAASGADMLLGCGLLHGSKILSYEQIVMDCEIFSIIRKMTEGITVDDETMAIDVIRSVGTGGHYLAQNHTRKHMRDLWMPHLMDRRPYEKWLADPTGARQLAHKKALNLIQTHHPEPLDKGLVKELSRLISAYEQKSLIGNTKNG
jgi:trimethylamine--corrinoid protein Co-methyltransferase